MELSGARIEWALADALRGEGCPVCRILRDDERRYWEHFLYEGFQDPAADARLAESVGYCERHLRQLAARRDVFASATLALASVRGALARLAGARPRPPRAGAGCPVCESLAGSERVALEALVRLVEAGDEAEAYAGSDGLCYDHVGLALAAHGRRARTLRTHALDRLERSRAELLRLVESFDHRSEPADAELAGAWRRAFRALRGDPGRIGDPRSRWRR